MKIVVVFFVVAVSSCSGLKALGGDIGLPVDDVHLPDVPSVSTLLENCLIETLKESQVLLLQFALLICTYEKGLDKLNDANWEAVHEALHKFLHYAGCEVDNILGTSAVEKLADPTSDVTVQLLKILRPILDKSGLSKIAFETACGLTEKFLSPTCLPLLLGGDIPLLLIDLATQACPGIDKDVAYDDLLRIVKRVSCLLTDAPLNLDKVVKNIKPDINGDLIYKGAARPFGDLIVDVLCIAAKILIPDLII